MPDFSLQAAMRSQSALNGAAVALVSDHESKAVTLQFTKEAANEGVGIGLSVGQALARCPGLKIIYRSQQAEEHAWKALHSAAYSIAPRVERQFEDLCVVDLRGRKETEAIQECSEVISGLKSLSLVVRAGIAETDSLALLAAKRAEKVTLLSEARYEKLHPNVVQITNKFFLDTLPIESVEPGNHILEILTQWGIRTVGKFASLKRSSVGNRLGMEGLVLWDRVKGRGTRVIGVLDLPLVFEMSWEFEREIENLEPLLFLVRRFMEQLCFEMKRAHKVATLLILDLGLAYGEPLLFEQKIPDPNSNHEALFRLLVSCLDGVSTDSPVDRFSLRMDYEDHQERQYGLFDSSLKNPHRFSQTLTKLAGIVGTERLGRPVMRPEGRPDGFELEAMPQTVEVDDGMALEECIMKSMKRYRPMLEAKVELQGGVPVWIQSDEVSGFVGKYSGPWVRSGHWWEKEGLWNRSEWDIRLRKGGGVRLVKDGKAWCIEGSYG
ncbi:DNA polymerase Y family protein [Puniceicoccaceae bacterium K14]|nr:DNA polymerase Y family protein [Puniceicoccaceae bacterium K14]